MLNVIIDKSKINIIQNWGFFAKNFDGISNKLIANRDLLKLDIHILTLDYSKEKRPYFIKIMKNNNEKLD